MIFKRGNVYWYKFRWSVKAPDGTTASFLVRRSARAHNQRRAKEQEDEHRRALRLGQIHPLDSWPVPPVPEAPGLGDFSERFLAHAKLHVKGSSLRYYETCVARLRAFPELAATLVSKINGELIARYVRSRLGKGLSVSTVNGDIRVLRRMLKLAYEWGVIPKVPVVHELPGAKGRERVLTFEEERRYLTHASPTLKVLTVLAVDTGLRPNSELFCLEWESVQLEPADHAPYVRVREGKTDSAVRLVPLTPRAQEALLGLKRLNRHERWVFPGSGNSGHLVSIQQVHKKAIVKSGVRPFQFYCWRHTFGTRCAESGMDRFTLAKLMGHSSPRVSERYYIHISEPHVAVNFEKFLEYQSRGLAAATPPHTAP